MLNRRRVSGFKIQLNIQIAFLAELVTAVRSGRYIALPAPLSSIILVGHSFGSLLTNSLVATKPTLADAAIMTGYNNLIRLDGRVALQGFAPRIARCTYHQVIEIKLEVPNRMKLLSQFPHSTNPQILSLRCWVHHDW